MLAFAFAPVFPPSCDGCIVRMCGTEGYIVNYVHAKKASCMQATAPLQPTRIRTFSWEPFFLTTTLSLLRMARACVHKGSASLTLPSATSVAANFSRVDATFSSAARFRDVAGLGSGAGTLLPSTAGAIVVVPGEPSSCMIASLKIESMIRYIHTVVTLRASCTDSTTGTASNP